MGIGRIDKKLIGSMYERTTTKGCARTGGDISADINRVLHEHYNVNVSWQN